MPATYNILIMGASYGSLLASKLLFGGHAVKLVCLPAEADLINAEGFRVRMPVKGRKDLVEIELAQAAGQGVGGRPGRRQSGGLRSRRACDAGAAIPLARRARTARRGGEVARALHVDHEHAAAALREAHPRPRLRCAQGRLYRPDRVGQLRSRTAHLVQPRSAGDPPAGGEGQRAAGHAADQLQGRAVRQRQVDRHPAPARAGDRRGALRRRRKARSNCRSSCGCTTRSSCRSPSGRCCSPATIAA